MFIVKPTGNMRYCTHHAQNETQAKLVLDTRLTGKTCHVVLISIVHHKQLAMPAKSYLDARNLNLPLRRTEPDAVEGG